MPDQVEDEKLAVVVAALRGLDLWACTKCGMHRTAPRSWRARVDGLGYMWLRCTCARMDNHRPHRMVKHTRVDDV